jgi:hypothetical protein
MRALAIVLLISTTACAGRRITRAPQAAPVTIDEHARVTPPSRAPIPALPPRTTTTPEPQPAAPTMPPQPAATAEAGAALAPLDEAQRSIFFATEADEPPEDRQSIAGVDNERHYVAGNEKRLDAFAATIADKRGGYVGVGSDQAYLFIGWARPELAWLVDYDPAVVDMHTVYRAFLRAAQTPEAFMRLWEADAKDEALAAIANEPTARKRHRAAYGRNRGWVLKRLRAVTNTMRATETASFLTDAAQYDYVRELVLADRVRALVADLKGEGAVQGIADAATQLGVPIRVLYLSNAEGYWSRYKGRFRRNIAALPFDDAAVVLRTLLIWHVNTDYRYNVQSAKNYLQWLARPFIGTVYDIVHDKPEPVRGELNFFVTDGDPDASPAARRAQERQAR